jgi:hypothetical protein
LKALVGSDPFDKTKTKGERTFESLKQELYKDSFTTLEKKKIKEQHIDPSGDYDDGFVYYFMKDGIPF